MMRTSSICILLIVSFILVHFQHNQTIHIRHLQDSSNNNVADSNSKMPKVLIYITTHMSQQHKEHLKHCWPLALKNSQLLNNSDIKVYLTPNPTEVNESIQLLKDTFPTQNLSYHINVNKGYHEGAIGAMSEGIKHGWFDDYDWIFRVNPDVIIQNDTWMLDIITNDNDASFIYIECQPHLTPRIGNNVRLVHTDFFGLKMSNPLIKECLLQQKEGGAEIAFSQQMAPIIEKGEHRHLPDSYPVIQGMCRVNGNPYGSVYHFQDDFNWVVHIAEGNCPAHFPNLVKEDEQY